MKQFPEDLTRLNIDSFRGALGAPRALLTGITSILAEAPEIGSCRFRGVGFSRWKNSFYLILRYINRLPCKLGRSVSIFPVVPSLLDERAAVAEWKLFITQVSRAYLSRTCANVMRRADFTRHSAAVGIRASQSPRSICAKRRLNFSAIIEIWPLVNYRNFVGSVTAGNGINVERRFIVWQRNAILRRWASQMEQKKLISRRIARVMQNCSCNYVYLSDEIFY